MTHAGKDIAQCPVPPFGVRLVDHLHPATAVAPDPQEPRRERPERLDQRAGWRGQWVVAVAAPVPLGERPGGHSKASGGNEPRAGLLASFARAFIVVKFVQEYSDLSLPLGSL